MTQEEGTYHPRYNPVSWGTLFFLLWVSLKTDGANTTYGILFTKAQEYIAWFILGISLILWLSIVITPLAKALKKERVERSFVPWVFNISFLSYAVAWVGKFEDFFNNFGANSLEANIVVMFGFIWMIIYLTIFVYSLSIHHRWISVSFSSVGLAGSVYYLFSNTNKWGGIILIVISLFLLFVTAGIIPVNYSPFPDDEQ